MPEKETRINPLKESLDQKGIELIAWDLDDTLLATNALFSLWIHRFVSAVVEKNPNLNWREVKEKFDEINNKAFDKLVVARKKLTFVANQLDSVFGTGPSFLNHEDIVWQIYNNAPEILDGARETLDAFKEADKPMISVTHSYKGWTDLKVDTRDIRKYFSHIENVDENKLKGPKDWLSAINTQGVKPAKVLAIGDNLKGDIISAHEIGVKHLVWIRSPWIVYRQGKVPEGVIVVDSIKDVTGALMLKPSNFHVQNQG